MLIALTDKSGKQVWVNAFTVREVKPRKGGCDVVYGVSSTCRTEEDPAGVVERINDAMLTVANPAALAALVNQTTPHSDDGAAALGAVL